MHKIQRRILKLAKERNIGSLGYRRIGQLVGEEHPQKIKWHLQKLIRDKLLVRQPESRLVAIDVLLRKSDLIPIPLLGRANCGQPLSETGEDEGSYIQVSRSCVPRGSRSSCFAVQAVGDSMNLANISGCSILDGDIVVVDGRVRQPREGDCLLASIGGLATIKRFHRDDERSRIVLQPQSTSWHAPVVIHSDDMDSCLIHGRVIDVIKMGAN